MEVADGLLDKKHVEQMGPAVWLYLLLLAWTPFDSSWVRRKNPISLSEIQTSLGIPKRTAKRWMTRLRRHGYVVSTGTKSGLTIAIKRRKSKIGKKLVEVPISIGAKNGPNQIQLGPKMAPMGAKNGPNKPELGPKMAPIEHLEYETTTSCEPASGSSSELPQTLFLTEQVGTFSESGSKPDPKTTEEIARDRIRELSVRYGQETRLAIREGFERCKSARKTGKMAGSIAVAVMEYFAKFRPEDVLAGSQAFLSREGIAGTPEAYWRGCVRGARARRERAEENEGCD